MSLTLVYTGEHYVADVILGWAYALATYAVVSRALDWRARRADRAAPAPIPPAVDEPAPVAN